MEGARQVTIEQLQEMLNAIAYNFGGNQSAMRKTEEALSELATMFAHEATQNPDRQR